MASIVHKANRPKPFTVRWFDGGRHRSRAFKSEEDAIKYLSVVQTGKGGSIPTLYAGMQLWLSEVETTCRHMTYIHYRHIAKAACTYYGKDIRLDKITSNHIAQYRDSLATTRHAKTVNNHLRAIRAFFNVAIRRGWLVNSPVKAVKFPRYRSHIPDWIDQATAQTLVDAARTAPVEIRVAVVLAVRAGLRLGDIVALRWSDVAHGQITVNEGKSKDPRAIPIHRDVAEVLAVMPRTGTYILPHIHDPTRHRHTHQFGNKVNKWLSKNGFSVGLHGLRHSFACHLAEAGATMVDLRRLMGHTSIATTEIYLHSSPGRQADLISRLGQPAIPLRVLTGETAPPMG